MRTLEQRKQKWREFYTSSENASLVLVQIDDGYPRPWPYDEYKKERYEWSLGAYRRQIERMAWLEDDRIPFLNPYTGTEIFARAFGAKIHKTGDNMPFALPMVQNSKELAKIKKPKLESSTLMELFDMADALRKAEPDGVLALPDIQSPLDIAALLWSKDTFFIAMLEEPQTIKDLAAMTHDLLVEFLDAWFARYGRDFIAHYPDYYMPQGITLSEDEIGAINSELFEEFVAENLNALSRRYGGIGIHCCANARHQWDNFKKVENLRLLNLCQWQVIEEAYPFFAHTCAQMHCSNPAGNGPYAGRIIWCESVGNDRQEAMDHCKTIREKAAWLLRRSD